PRLRRAAHAGAGAVQGPQGADVLPAPGGPHRALARPVPRAHRPRAGPRHAGRAHHGRPEQPGLRHHVHQLLHRTPEVDRGPGPGHPRRRLPRHPQRRRAPAAKEEPVSNRTRGAWPSVLLAAGLAALGCGPAAAPSGPPPPQAPEVSVSLPVHKEVTDYEDFPGRVEAMHSIEVRARVAGYLDKVHFREGDEVKKGDLLFEIDPRPYEAELTRAEGTVLQGQGRMPRLELDFRRAADLLRRSALSREDFDRVNGDRVEAEGALKAATGSRDMARLNLEFTKVRAPLSGRISRRFIDPGNLVKA